MPLEVKSSHLFVYWLLALPESQLIQPSLVHVAVISAADFSSCPAYISSAKPKGSSLSAALECASILNSSSSSSSMG
jgi:hypothetical protein